MDLAAAIHIPSPPPSLRKSIPSEFEMDDSYNQISQLDLSAMSLKDRCNAQQSLLNSFREKVKNCIVVTAQVSGLIYSI